MLTSDCIFFFSFLFPVERRSGNSTRYMILFVSFIIVLENFTLLVIVVQRIIFIDFYHDEHVKNLNSNL